MTSPVDMIYDIETEVLENIVRLLSQGSDDSALWQAQKLAQMGTLRSLNKKAIEKGLKKAIAEALNELRSRGIETARDIDSYMPNIGLSLPVDADPVLIRVWDTWESLLRNQLLSMGSTLMVGAENAYHDAIRKATAQALAGQKTLRQAIADTAEDWGNNGIRTFTDKAGRKWTTEATAQMIIRSNIRQTVTDTSFARMDEMDLDLIEVSSHIGARPGCAPYQGRIYSKSGNSLEYPAFSETSYGEVDGLGGANCGHRFYPYIPGTKKTYHPYPEKLNDKVYEASQQQRQLERNIRNAKRGLSLAKQNGDEALIAKQKKKVLTRQAQMRQFIDESGRTRRNEREQIY